MIRSPEIRVSSAMDKHLFLLRLAGKAALNALGGGIAGDLLLEALPELASDLWKRWAQERNAAERQEDLAEVAQASGRDIKAAVATIVLEMAFEEPKAQDAMGLYLSLIPGQVRKSLRRPSDPLGGTVPYEMVPNKPEDLIPLLPERLPRFKPGDQPLPAVDWELEELLGMGGFGEVWKAKNPLLSSVPPVALKFCLDPSARQYLRNEAAVLDRVMRQGRHPGIVTLQHTYLSAETPCLEYEFVSGGDLAGMIQEWYRRGSRPSAIEIARVMQTLAEIIAFAHGQPQPIVHRDLKPANIMRQLGPNGSQQLKVGDFGIGGLATRQAIEQQTRGSTRGMFLATALRGSCTPLYASPQQMRGDAPDPRDDIYSLGVIWYQMLNGDLCAGRPGGTKWQGRLASLGMPSDLVDVLSDCLEDQLEDRISDGVELNRRLLTVLPAEAVRLPTPAPKVQTSQSAKPTGPEERLAELTFRLLSGEPDANLLAERGEVNRLLGRPDRAIEDCTEAIRLDSTLGDAYATRGSVYRTQGKLDLAIADATRAIELNANLKLAWYTRGECYRLKGAIDRAISDSTEALRLDPTYPQAYGTRGAAFQAQKNFARSIADLDEYAKLEPNNAWVRMTRGETYRLMGDLDRAIVDSNEALKLQPESSHALAIRGAAFRQKGDFATAMADLNAALRLRPDNQFAQDQLRLAKRGQK